MATKIKPTCLKAIKDQNLGQQRGQSAKEGGAVHPPTSPITTERKGPQDKAVASNRQFGSRWPVGLSTEPPTSAYAGMIYKTDDHCAQRPSSLHLTLPASCEPASCSPLRTHRSFPDLPAHTQLLLSYLRLVTTPCTPGPTSSTFYSFSQLHFTAGACHSDTACRNGHLFLSSTAPV